MPSHFSRFSSPSGVSQWNMSHVINFHGVFTLAWSGTGTGTGTGTGIMHNLSHCTWTGKNGLYGFNKNLSDCTWTGTGKNTSIHHQEHFQDLKNGYQTHSSGPENVPSVLPCLCSGAAWKVLIKTIQPILPGRGPCPGPGSGPSQCEYAITLQIILFNFSSTNVEFMWALVTSWSKFS